MKTIKSFISETWRRIFAPYEGTEQENAIIAIVKSIIDLPSTNKIMYDRYSGYFSNDVKKIYVMFNENRIILVNNDTCMEYPCNSRFFQLFDTTITDYMSTVISRMNEKLKESQKSMLDEISKKLLK